MSDEIVELCLKEIAAYLKVIYLEYFRYCKNPTLPHLRNQLTTFTKNVLNLKHETLVDHIEARQKDRLKQKEKI